MEQIVQPFTPMPYPSLPAAPPAPPAASLLPALLLSLWLCGLLAVLLYEWTRYRRVAAAVRSATPLTNGRELEALRRLQCKCMWGQAYWPAMTPSGVISRAPSPAGLSTLWKWKNPAPRLVSSTANLEPGVFGIFRPILWLPAGIANRLEDAELEAILAHELCHIRHRDNLLATLHLLVESLFWFHPLVWWLGARLEEERERACDEEVVRLGGEPQVYAESILKVVEFYLASPVACAAGVSGGELKRRIESIMTNRIAVRLNFTKKAALALAGIAALGAPLVVAFAQNAAAPPKFEVASVKLATDQNIVQTRPTRSIGRFRWKTDLVRILSYAYHMESWRISDAPGLDRIYDLEATTPPNTGQDEVRLMLRDLLTERFHLVTHLVTRNVNDGYSLTVSKGGSKLQPTKALPESASGEFDEGYVVGTLPEKDTLLLRGHNASILQLAEFLQRDLGTSVIDKTNLTGRYDFELMCTRDGSGMSPNLWASCIKRAGLAIEKYKGPVEFLVIDQLGSLVEN
jgi:uncharacterized protein (TIGR03435 family)